MNKRIDLWRYFPCDSSYFFIKSRFKLYVQKKCIDIKEPKASLISTPSHQANSLHFITVLSWFEIIASYMAFFFSKKLSVQTVVIISIKSEQAFLFTIITFLRIYIFLHLRKEDGFNRSVLVYMLVIFIPLSYFFEEHR